MINIPSDQRGFSLVEVLASLTIFLLILVTVSQLFTFAGGAFAGRHAWLDRDPGGRSLIRSIRRDIADAYPPDVTPVAEDVPAEPEQTETGLFAPSLLADDPDSWADAFEDDPDTAPDSGFASGAEADFAADPAFGAAPASDPEPARIIGGLNGDQLGLRFGRKTVVQGGFNDLWQVELALSSEDNHSVLRYIADRTPEDAGLERPGQSVTTPDRFRSEQSLKLPYPAEFRYLAEGTDDDGGGLWVSTWQSKETLPRAVILVAKDRPWDEALLFARPRAVKFALDTSDCDAQPCD